MALIVDASVALKWVLPEPDSSLAQALAESDEELLLPDFWLNEATNICWLQMHKGKWSADEAREALDLLRAQVPAIPTGDLALHEVALEIGLAISHSTYDALYVPLPAHGRVESRATVRSSKPWDVIPTRHKFPYCSRSRNGRIIAA